MESPTMKGNMAVEAGKRGSRWSRFRKTSIFLSWRRNGPGDLDEMAERRVIRVLTVYRLGKYYIDNGREKGITYELFKMFEDSLNKS